MRGSTEQASRLTEAERLAVYRVLVRNFYRPMQGQARWIDPRPLPHSRRATHDEAVPADDALAAAIAWAADHPRVCALEGDDEACRGRAGGVIRFSAPYATASDTVVVFSRYTPVRAKEDPSMGEAANRPPGAEMQFWLARRGGEWRIAREATLEGTR